jgi:hypothetical protein
MRIDLFHKTRKVIKSCKTLDQLTVANRYRLKANTRLGRNRNAVEVLRELYYRKLRELEPVPEPFPGWCGWEET